MDVDMEVQHDMDMQHGYGRMYSMAIDMQPEIDMEHGHGHAPWTRTGTMDMDMHYSTVIF
jgi:hypothetical protein